MSASRIIILLQYSLIFLAFNCCKQNANHKQLHITEIIIEQIILSSIVHNSLFSIPDSIELPILIYRYSDDMCAGCIFEDLENLKTFQNKIGKDRILVLPAFDNNARNRARMLYELVDFNYRNFPLSSMVIPILDTMESQQYFAVINSNGEIDMVFFPKMGYSAITKAYFEKVEERIRK